MEVLVNDVLTAVIVCGIQAARGQLSLEWVIVWAAAGAFTGDNASYAVGRWLEEGASKFKSDMQGAQEKFDQFGGQARDAAKEATGAIIRLPNARPLTGRERCAPGVDAALPGGG